MEVVISKNKKWKRSQNGYLAGVCQGLGESFNINPNLLRVIWFATVWFFGTGIFLYFLCALLLPREDKILEYHQDKILGVCRRISERGKIELPIVRMLAVLSAISSFGITILLYLFLHFLLEKPQRRINL